MTITLKLTAGLMCCSLLGGAQHISIPTPGAVYRASMDDVLPRRMNVQLLPVFSPLVDTSTPLNPYLTAVGNHEEKVMLSPLLDECRAGNRNCPPTIVDDAFLPNARANLQKGRDQVRDLKQERLPASLEPVRRFLLDNLITAVHMEEARYQYISTGAVAPLKAMLDRYCSTGNPELIGKLEKAPDPETRRELSIADWHNALFGCYEKRVGGYPVEAWKKFLAEFHVQESVELHLEE